MKSSSPGKRLDFNETGKNAGCGVGIAPAHPSLSLSISKRCCGEMGKAEPGMVSPYPIDSKSSSSFLLIPEGGCLSSYKTQKPFCGQWKQRNNNKVLLTGLSPPCPPARPCTDWVCRASLPLKWGAQPLPSVLVPARSLVQGVVFCGFHKAPHSGYHISQTRGLSTLTQIPTCPSCRPGLQSQKPPYSARMLLDCCLCGSGFPPTLFKRRW